MTLRAEPGSSDAKPALGYHSTPVAGTGQAGPTQIILSLRIQLQTHPVLHTHNSDPGGLSQEAHSESILSRWSHRGVSRARCRSELGGRAHQQGQSSPGRLAPQAPKNNRKSRSAPLVFLSLGLWVCVCLYQKIDCFTLYSHMLSRGPTRLRRGSLQRSLVLSWNSSSGSATNPHTGPAVHGTFKGETEEHCTKINAWPEIVWKVTTLKHTSVYYSPSFTMFSYILLWPGQSATRGSHL